MKKQLLPLVAGIMIGAMAFGGIAAAADLVVVLSTQKVYVDGQQKAVEAYNINGSNYFKARDFAAAMDVGMWYNAETSSIMVETDKGYDAGYTGPIATEPTGKTAIGTVLMDKDGVKVSYLGIEKIEYMVDTYYINLKIENNSAADYTVQTREEIINDIVTHNTSMSENVPSGKTAYGAIHAMMLGADGIAEPLEKIEFYFHIVTPKTWDLVFDTDTITIYP